LRLGADERLPLGTEALRALIALPIKFVGAAEQQVQSFVESVQVLVKKHPSAASYTPGAML
jgi:adenylosuccinate lyase